MTRFQRFSVFCRCPIPEASFTLRAGDRRSRPAGSRQPSACRKHGNAMRHFLPSAGHSPVLGSRYPERAMPDSAFCRAFCRATACRFSVPDTRNGQCLILGAQAERSVAHQVAPEPGTGQRKCWWKGDAVRSALQYLLAKLVPLTVPVSRAKFPCFARETVNGNFARETAWRLAFAIR